MRRPKPFPIGQKIVRGSFIEAQRQWSQIALEQSGELMKAVQSGADFQNPNILESLQKTAGQGLEMMAQMRTAWLDFANNQNTRTIDALKQGLNLDKDSPVNALADFAQNAMNSYVEIQKRWLDMATQLPLLNTQSQDKK